MKSIIQQIAAQNKARELAIIDQQQAEIHDPYTGKDRRNFLKKFAFGGISLGAIMGFSFEDTPYFV